jgi:hypothetical protein
MGFILPFPRFRLWALLACLLLAAGCSSLRMGYSHADTLLLAGLDRYFDLDDPQKEWARGRIDALLAWHRSTQLRDYAVLLREAREKIRGPVSADDVLAFQGKLRARLVALAERVSPDLAELALRLQPTQLARMQERWAEEREEFRETAAEGGTAALAREQARRFEKMAGFWLDDLSPDQKALIQASFTRHEALVRIREDERERRRRDWLALLQGLGAERSEPKEATARVRAYFAGLGEPAEPVRRAQYLALRQANAELIAALLNAATPEQRAELRDKLESYARDFGILASEGAGTGG